MADTRPVKPGIYSKIVDLWDTKNELKKVDIDSSFDELRKAAMTLGIHSKEEELEFVKSIASSRFGVPKDRISVSRVNKGYEVLISPEEPMDSVTMEVTYET